MKTYLSISFLLLGSFIFAQNFEQIAAEKSCECLHKLPEINDKNYQNCISSSLTEALTMGDVKANMEKINTVDGMTTALKEIDILIKNTCLVDGTSGVEEKRTLHYSLSKNDAATNFYRMGKDFMESGKYKPAIEAFEMALKNDPEFVLALDDLAASYRKLENFDQAIHYYNKSLSIFPEGDFALMNIAVIYTMKKNYQTAAAFYLKLIKFQPDNAEGYYGLGRIFYFRGVYEDALINIIKAHKIYVVDHPDYSKDSQQMMEIIYQEMKQKGKEKDFIRIAKENGVNIK